MPEHSPSPTPERAIYGFVLYLAAYVVLALYLVWAYIPNSWLHAVGLTYWPQKYWAIAAPVYACVTFVFIIVFYVAYNFTITPSLDSINTVKDKHSRPVQTQHEVSQAIPPLGDLDISEVNRQLYGQDESVS